MALIKLNNNSISAVTELPSAIATGNLVKISKSTISGTPTTLDLDNIFSSTYDNYKIIGRLQTTYAGNTFLNARVGTGSTPTYLTTGHFYNNNGGLTFSNGSESSLSNGEYNAQWFAIGAADLRSSFASFEITCVNINSTSANVPNFMWTYVHNDQYENRIEGNTGRGSNSTTAGITSLRLLFRNGNINAGEVVVYGIGE